MSHDLASALACPRCGGQLAGLEPPACAGCQVTFPVIDGIPVLVPDFDEWLARCLQGLLFFRLKNDEEVSDLREQLKDQRLLSSTRERLFSLIEGKKHQRDQIEMILSPLTTPVPSGWESKLFGSPKDAIHPERYWDNLVRDWAWGDSENAASLSLITEALGSFRQPQRMAVLGAGACRLAVDLHRSLESRLTLALDHHPVLTLGSSRILQGEALSLVDFPPHPTQPVKAAVKLTAVSPADVGAGDFAQIIADALRPPFPPGALDVVVTPWFIDVIPTDLRELAPSLNRWLRPGGLWVNFGPMLYGKARAQRAYTADEILQIAAASGFAVASHSRASVSYLQSPHGSTRRYEEVLTFVAKKTSETRPSPSRRAADWMDDARRPIPLSASLVDTLRISTQYLQVLSLIDGKRSLEDVAAILSPRLGIAKDRLVSDLRVLLGELSD